MHTWFMSRSRGQGLSKAGRLNKGLSVGNLFGIYGPSCYNNNNGPALFYQFAWIQIRVSAHTPFDFHDETLSPELETVSTKENGGPTNQRTDQKVCN